MMGLTGGNPRGSNDELNGIEIEVGTLGSAGARIVVKRRGTPL